MPAPIFPFSDGSDGVLAWIDDGSELLGTSSVGVPGPAGPAGANGSNGTNGENAFTTTTANFTQPAVAATVSVSVSDSDWMANGQIIFVRTGGYYKVSNVVDGTTVVLENLGYDGNAAPAAVINSGSKVSPGGLVGPTGASVAVAGVYFSDVDPNGVITATRPAVCYSTAGRQWVKTNAINDNTNWVEILGTGV